jgi:putative drug exporter of the RND superfamily
MTAGARPTQGARWLAAVSRRPAAALAAGVVVLAVLAMPALKLTLALRDNGSEIGLGAAVQLGAVIGATAGRGKDPGGHRRDRCRASAG